MKLDDDVHEFLNRELPGFLAVIGTFGKDGYPQLVPVWYRWDGEQILVWTLESRAWVQNVVRDDRVGVSIAEEQGAMAVMLRGRATLETGGHPAIDEEIQRITRRYVPADDIDGYLSDWTHLRTIMRIKPHKHYVWR